MRNKKLIKKGEIIMIYINGLNKSKISYRKGANGHRFAAIKLPCRDISIDGKMSITVDTTAIRKNLSNVDELRNICLGEPEVKRTVSVCVQSPYGPVYEKIKLTNREIYRYYMDDIARRTRAVEAKAAVNA